MYYRGASAAIIVYDVTSAGSFERAKDWVEELEAQCGTEQDLVVVIAGNKLDLVLQEPSCRRVTREEAQEYAAENDIYSIETSAKDAHNVHELFTRLAHQLATNLPPAPANSDPVVSPHNSASVPISQTPAQPSGGCCRS